MGKRQIVIDGEQVVIEDGTFADGTPCFRIELLGLQDCCEGFTLPAGCNLEHEISIRLTSTRGIRNYQEWLANRHDNS